MEYEIHELADLFPRTSAEDFASLTESIRVYGLRQPITVWRGEVIDGRHRLDACRRAGVEPRYEILPDETDALAYVIDANLNRRHLTTSQRAMVAADVANLKHGSNQFQVKEDGEKSPSSPESVSQGEAAERLGVSRDVVKQANRVKDFANDTLTGAVRGGAVSVSDAANAVSAVKDEDPEEAQEIIEEAVERADNGEAKTVAKATNTVKRERKRKKAVEEMKEDAPPFEEEKPPVIHCAIADLHAHIPAASADAIITDPPYTAETLDAFGELATFAVHALKPGGVVLAMSGTMFIPEILRQMDVDGLSYRWLLAYHQPGGGMQVHSKKMTTEWTPILAFTRDGAQPAKYATDFVSATVGRHRLNKHLHEWGKDVGAFAALIEEFVEPGGLVVDPFVGGGTTGVAAKKLGAYQFLGADIDEGAVALSVKAWREAND